MIRVLVTGGGGQLAHNIRAISRSFPTIQFTFKSSQELDITDKSQLERCFNESNYQYCINCAAYTAVDLAEKNRDTANAINNYAVSNLAEVCNKLDVILIHISTDFVFNGNTSIAYKESDATNPLGIYGLTKLNGELAITDKMKHYFILRTSWLYSEYNHNFMKSMLRLASTKDQLGVVDDQIGTPTYARDLAKVILKIINSESQNFGIYHYSNEGVACWYDFAQAIFNEAKISILLKPIKTADFPTLAKRPVFSVLDKSKIKSTFGLEIPHWRHSLSEALINFNQLDNQ